VEGQSVKTLHPEVAWRPRASRSATMPNSCQRDDDHGMSRADRPARRQGALSVRGTGEKRRHFSRSLQRELRHRRARAMIARRDQEPLRVAVVVEASDDQARARVVATQTQRHTQCATRASAALGSSRKSLCVRTLRSIRGPRSSPGSRPASEQRGPGLVLRTHLASVDPGKHQF